MKQGIRRYLTNKFSLVSRWIFATLVAATLISSEALAAGGGKPATKLINVADTRAMGTGFAKMIADIYNSNLWLYGLTVVIVMAAMGAILGFAFDRLVIMLGIDLGKLEHHE